MSNKQPFIALGCTRTVQDGSLTIEANWGIRGFSVLNLSTSTTNGTLNGGTSLSNGLASQALSIPPGGSRAWSAPEGQYLSGMVIISPDANCTLQVQLLL